MSGLEAVWGSESRAHSLSSSQGFCEKMQAMRTSVKTNHSITHLTNTDQAPVLYQVIHKMTQCVSLRRMWVNRETDKQMPMKVT